MNEGRSPVRGLRRRQASIIRRSSQPRPSMRGSAATATEGRASPRVRTAFVEPAADFRESQAVLGASATAGQQRLALQMNCDRTHGQHPLGEGAAR